MTYNEEIKELVTQREEKVNVEFDILVKEILKNFYLNGNCINLEISFNNSLIIKHKFEDILADDYIPVIYSKYFKNVKETTDAFANFLCDFEYYLYMNTDFIFYEENIPLLGKILCIQLPI